MTIITRRRYFGFAFYYIINAISNGRVIAAVMDTDYNSGIRTLNLMIKEEYA